MQRVAAAACRDVRRRGAQAQVISALSVTRTVVDQVGLTASGRRINVSGAFAATTPHPAHREVIIVDDITTSGATLAEAQRALITAGWFVRGAAVVAQTSPRLGVAGRPSLG